MNNQYEYKLLRKCYEAINPNTNPDLIREIAAYLAGPLPDEEISGDSKIGGPSLFAAIDAARSEGKP